MQAVKIPETNTRIADVTCAQRLHSAPHPISAGPQFKDNEQGYGRENSSHVFAYIPETPHRMLLTTGEDDEESAMMKCCCGRPDCAYLEHNNAALEGLEKDLETAARLGQALLSRHESYINESQAEQARLSTCITDLESERLSLQNANEKMVAENRDLQQQLSNLNRNIADSDLEVARLEGLLLDCELEVKRLNTLLRRTEELDARVQQLEKERRALNNHMQESHEESQSMLTRWKESERRVHELEDDVQRIEMEARLDREKHEEIVARLEKERSFDRELGGAEGRLKGAVAIQNMGMNGPGSKNVVSHFVRDILQDNANLQAGITELRQLLHASNQEVQNLREQVLLHQPLHPGDEENDDSTRSLPLDQDLAPRPVSSTRQQEVHVHHHYHAKLPKSRVTTPRKSTKRRVVMSGHDNVGDFPVPLTPISQSQRNHSSPVVPVSLYQPQPQKNRWSMQSTATMSSVLSSMPSTPRSYFDRGGSIFDRLEQGEELSRPTSPESIGDLLSPAPGPWKFRRDTGILDACEEEDQNVAFELSPLLESKPQLDTNPLLQAPSVQPAELDQELTPKPSLILQPFVDVSNITHGPQRSDSEDKRSTANNTKSVKVESSEMTVDILSGMRPSLSRKGSRETLVSISGMDIHIARRASPGATLELLHSHFANGPAHNRKVSTVQPLASVTEFTAISTPAFASTRESRNTTGQMPASIEALSGIAIPKSRLTQHPSQIGAISRLGGWVRGKWGVAPTKSTGNLRRVSLDQTSTTSPITNEPTLNDRGACTMAPDIIEHPQAPLRSISVPDQRILNSVHAKVDPAILFAGRSPGVNQPGFMLGVRAAMMNKRTPSQVMATVIDEEGLQDGLAE